MRIDVGSAQHSPTLSVGENPCCRALVTDGRSGPERRIKIRRQGIRQRTDGAPRFAPAIVQARRTAVVGARIDGNRHGCNAHSKSLESPPQQSSLSELVDRRQWIRLAGRAPHFGRRIARNSDFTLDAVIERPQVIVTNRPVEAYSMVMGHGEVLDMKARPTGILMHPGPARALTGIHGKINRVVALLDHLAAVPMIAPRKDLR